RRVVPVETTTSNALVSYDGSGYDWSLESVEARLLVYKKNKSIYEEDIKLTVENFENSSKSLSKLIDCQIVDKCKTGLGYNVVPPPYTGNFMPPKPNMSFSSLKEFTSEPIVIKPIVEKSEAKATEAKPGAPVIDDWVSDSEEENVSQTKIEKKTAKPSFVKIDFVKAKQTNKTNRKTAKQADCKKVNQKQFQNIKPVWNNARPMTNLSKSAHSTVKWPIHKNTTFKNSNFNPRVNTIKDKKINTARPKEVVNAARPKAVVNAVKGNNVNVGNPQIDLQDKGVIDSGCSRHMTENMSYLTNYEEIDRGYVAFGGNPKRGKITGKCTIKTGNLDFENTADPLFSSNSKSSPDAGFKPSGDDEKKIDVKSVFLYGLQQVPRLLYGNLSTYLLDNGFQRGKIDKTLFRRDKGLQGKARRWEFFSVKTSIVTEILKKIILTDVKTASHTYGKSKAFWRQDEDVEEVEVHLYNQLQFWATVKAKTVNDEVQLQALVDGKKVIIIESTVRRDLHLEDDEGVDCLPNATIFE
ncbi:hypothetical protein Tco_1057239, partial [Tanacetum coccineum]